MNEISRSADPTSAGANDDDDEALVEMTDFYDPIAALLSSIGGEAENLTEELRKYGIKYEHLSGLCDEDLALMGMKNKKIRNEVLSEISSLPNQMDHYDIAMKSLNVKTYVRNVLQNVAAQVDNLNAMLLLTKLRISAQHVENVQVAENKYASQVAVSVCQKLYTKTAELEDLVDQLKQGEPTKDNALELSKRSSRRSFLKKTIIATLVLGATIQGMKYFRVFSR
ncbi:uncharacterized protein LOC128745472 [Sabethes cyaneus]|uniref:uncharacterized protein LOC128745472 n=1 Tax=Sabethes cyaneus TaxID=53552 RepID=UPI00237DF7D5|nr:uncharacterized protein LOC128745472 [Sabethes cyaneus]